VTSEMSGPLSHAAERLVGQSYDNLWSSYVLERDGAQAVLREDFRHFSVHVSNRSQPQASSPSRARSESVDQTERDH